MAEWRISQKDTVDLINCFNQHECLWNYKSLLYKTNALKRKSWEEIANQFQKSVDEVLVKRKIKCLRTMYSYSFQIMQLSLFYKWIFLVFLFHSNPSRQELVVVAYSYATWLQMKCLDTICPPNEKIKISDMKSDIKSEINMSRGDSVLRYKFSHKVL